MKQEKLIADWEARAKSAGVSIAKVCRHAGIANSSFSRWKAGAGLLIDTADRFGESLAYFEDLAPNRRRAMNDLGQLKAQPHLLNRFDGYAEPLQFISAEAVYITGRSGVVASHTRTQGED